MSDSLGKSCELIETHISYVLLTGEFAYKIKKAVELGFLDFRSLAARRFYCEEELRLNRRLAPQLYLDVIAITGSVATPILGGSAPAIEYAVKMRQFLQDALASRTLARGELTEGHIDALAARIAAFHRTASVADKDGAFGQPEKVLLTAQQNFVQIRPLLDSDAEVADLDALAGWTNRQYAACGASMALRRETGFVRECHGDLHLNNIAFVDGELTIFDCIEFNEQMRWIDVMSEVAFTAMDLRDRGRPDFAHRFVNAYLEITGDYDGLSVLRFYLVYRAMVRAKVARLRAQQLENGSAKEASLVEYRAHLDIARHYARSSQPAIVITHGVAGSGKTTLSQGLLEMIGAVRLRTDVERKRLRGMPAAARDRIGVDEGLYAPAATQQTYFRMLQLARNATAAGFPVIVDGAFLKQWQRCLFRDLASELHVLFVIVSFVALQSVLRERIARRLQSVREASDADLAVLEHQLETQEVLTPDELAVAIVYDTQAPLAEAQQPARWSGVLDRLNPGCWSAATPRASLQPRDGAAEHTVRR